ncbi:NADH dehydrogenase of ubiquinone 1 beta subcomplex subunit 2 [Spatholobus suberectus]|nr:NADH dehydrogenase of ubiquinone 1 beta subcomplex subunit 2 [Spatholobus suberectus]
MGGGHGHGESTTYKGVTIHHPKRWHTLTGKGLCAVMWFWVLYRAKQDGPVVLFWHFAMEETNTGIDQIDFVENVNKRLLFSPRKNGLSSSASATIGMTPACRYAISLSLLQLSLPRFMNHHLYVCFEGCILSIAERSLFCRISDLPCGYN